MATARWKLEILDRVSDPGLAGKPNEDRLRAGDTFGLVIDGATGLGDGRLIAQGDSDAGWLAERGAELIADGLRRADADLSALTASVCRSLRAELSFALGQRTAPPCRVEDTPAYALPTASFQLVRLTQSFDGDAMLLETAGLGDCSLFAQAPDGGVRRASGRYGEPGAEQAAARRALETGALDGANGFLRSPEVLEERRRSRARHNQPGGEVWTLGVVEEAGTQLAVDRWTAAQDTLLLLATDGLANLMDVYSAYDGSGLLHAAQSHGLPALIEELRRIERIDDPTGARFPRFKQSDDATALLLRVSRASS